MIIDKNENTTVVSNESLDLPTFMNRLNGEYASFKSDNIVINLFSLSTLTVGQLLEFLPMSDSHRKGKKSFVIVTDKISFDAVPNTLEVVPTLQEAFDLIEMEEIERDLDF